MSKLRLLAVLLLILPVALRADTIIMKSGAVMDGEKVGEDDLAYEIKVEHGIVRVLKEKVKRIEQPTPEELAEKEAEDAKDREIAEQMKDEGKVKYKGKWVTDEEKAADEKKVATAKKKKEDDRAAAKKKTEAEAKKKKDAEQKRLADQQKQDDKLAKDAQLENDRADRFNSRHDRSHGGRLDDGSNNGNYNNNNYNNNNYNNNNYGNNLGNSYRNGMQNYGR